jgi:hypothetical protein
VSAASGQEFPVSTLWIVERVPSPTIAHTPLKFHTVGFPQYGFKHQAPCSWVCCFPTPCSALKSAPQHPWGVPCVCCTLRYWLLPVGLPVSACGPLALPVPAEPRGLAAEWLCCSLFRGRISRLVQSYGLRPPLFGLRWCLRPSLESINSNLHTSHRTEVRRIPRSLSSNTFGAPSLSNALTC